MPSYFSPKRIASKVQFCTQASSHFLGVPMLCALLLASSCSTGTGSDVPAKGQAPSVAVTYFAMATAANPDQYWRTHSFSETGLSLHLPQRYEGGRWEPQTYQFEAQNQNGDQGDVIHIFVDHESVNVEDHLRNFLSGPMASQAISGTIKVAKPVGWQGYIVTFQLQPSSPSTRSRSRFTQVLKLQSHAYLEIGLAGDTLVQEDMRLSLDAERIIASAQVFTISPK